MLDQGLPAGSPVPYVLNGEGMLKRLSMAR